MTGTLQSFLDAAGWGAAQHRAMTGDASARRYERLTAQDGRTAILMDASPQQGENIRPFTRIAGYLRSLGLSAPEIFAQDAEAGFLLLEDLGDRLFSREVSDDPARELPLYLKAADVLTTLHRAEPPADLPRFDARSMAAATDVAFDWYGAGAGGQDAPGLRDTILDEVHQALKPLDKSREVLIHRDYHAENLLWLPEREGVAAVGLLDFQDALRGSPAYDLVSLLQDARRDVSPEVARAVTEHFASANGHPPETFAAAYALIGFQRNLRILGVFARLCLRDGKSHYVDLIPRVWRHIETNLGHPSLAALAGPVARALPWPTATVLSRLKGQSGQWAGR